jgi:hypothetical protein
MNKKRTGKKYNSYSTTNWIKAYYDEYSGGYVVVAKQRMANSTLSKNEKEKFAKEFKMSVIFAKNGYAIEMLAEIPRIPSPDIKINGVLAELKKLASHNNIVKEAKEAIYKKGAEIVLFEFEKNSKKVQEELDKLKRVNIKVYYYFSNINKIHNL